MSVAKVLRLEEYRDRRAYRERLAEALYRVYPSRHAIFLLLAEVADLAGADRTATVWVDEYGTGLIHAHVVLDLSSDRPRRSFSVEPLTKAWELGVPSAYDYPAELTASVPTTFAISLGSDGTRAWFLVAESVASRPLLDREVRDRLMFLAGECSAVLLHRDLDVATGADGEASEAPRFAGWPILQDIEGRESDDAAGRRIAQRFVVGRLVRMLIDDDLTISPERIAEQVRRARAELSGDRTGEGAEVDLWHRVLDALEHGELEDLGAALVELGEVVERSGHYNGALEIYRSAYDIAGSIGVPRQAVDAARMSGRLLRRRARWDEAQRWYDVAREIADVASLQDLAAVVLSGLAHIKKETGNLPAAREGFQEALTVAEESGDREAIATVHHALLGLEHAAGDPGAGLEHGWIALATYESEAGRTRCMASLAGALAAYGDREAAEDAWTVVAHSSRDQYYLVYAHDALAYLCALKGDAEAFEAHAERCDALGWESGSRFAAAEILYYRGLSYRALGQLGRAEEWLSRAVAFAEEHGVSQVLFDAEEALRTRVESIAPRELREGLRAMRLELAGVED